MKVRRPVFSRRDLDRLLRKQLPTYRHRSHPMWSVAFKKHQRREELRLKYDRKANRMNRRVHDRMCEKLYTSPTMVRPWKKK